MKFFHNTEEDRQDERANTNEGLRIRIAWVLKLRAALQPFADGKATERDRLIAQTVLGETKEWLTPDCIR